MMDTLIKLGGVYNWHRILKEDKPKKDSPIQMVVGALVIGLYVLSIILIGGCKSVPTPEAMYRISSACGTAAGLIVNETKITAEGKAALIEVVQDVRTSVPKTNETFTAAWTPIAQKHVDELISKGKLDKGEGLIVMQAFGVATLGIDYVFERYPEAKQYEQLVSAATDGFTYSLLSSLGATPKAVNNPYLKSCATIVTSDDPLVGECYDAIKKSMKSMKK